MKIGIPKEINAGEKRVAVTPEVTGQLIKLGFEVQVESLAGKSANFTDADYEAAGASINKDTKALWLENDIILKIGELGHHPTLKCDETELLAENKIFASFVWPSLNPELLKTLADKKVTTLAMDNVPRISRAQKLDARSSMANISGYRAVLEAAHNFNRFFAGQITAAGKVQPAKVMVIGVGVAGLAAIGVANSMGAVVRAFDTRLEVKEQVESMGAEFLELDFAEDGSGEGGYAKVMSDEFIQAEMALFLEQAKEVDIIITTALIPGRPAPELITKEMVSAMKNGSVIVDLAAEQGGNCKLTKAGEIVEVDGVQIIGYTDLPSRLSTQASQMYGTNLRHLLTEMCPEKDGVLQIDMDNEVVRGLTATHQGEVTWPPPAPKLSAAPAAPKKVEPVMPIEPEKPKTKYWPIVVGALALALVGLFAPPSFLGHFTVFVLSCFIGYMVVWNVTPALHTPLMSVTNAISSIIIVGAIVQIDSTQNIVLWLSGIAILITAVNIFGGFAVTQRMLGMFQK